MRGSGTADISPANILYGTFNDAEIRQAAKTRKQFEQQLEAYHYELGRIERIRTTRQTLPTRKFFERLQEYDGDGLAPEALQYGLSESDIAHIFDWERNSSYYEPSNKAYKALLELLYPAVTEVELIKPVDKKNYPGDGHPKPGERGILVDFDDDPKLFVKWAGGSDMPLLLSDKFTLRPPEASLPSLPLKPTQQNYR